MPNENKTTILRFAIIFAILVCGFLTVLVRIILIQTRDSSHWELAEEVQDERIVSVPPMRGNIYDCNGQLMASSIPRFRLHMDPLAGGLVNKPDTIKRGKRKGTVIKRDSAFWNNIDTLSAALSRIVGDKTKQEYRNMIVEAKQQKKHYLLLTRDTINFLQYTQLMENPFIARGRTNSNRTGLIWDTIKIRTRPFGNLASRTVGTTGNTRGHGLTGLEKQYDSLLVGQAGIGVIRRVGGQDQVIIQHEPQNGVDIVTTIDANLQDIVEKELRGPVEAYGAKWGCCVLMDVHTGELKAVANLSRDKQGVYRETENRAFMRAEPGSTFKTIAMLAALDDHKITLNTPVSVTRAPWKYKDVLTHTDAHKMDATLTMRQVLAVSSNIGMAKIIPAAYDGSATKFIDKLNLMGVIDTLPYDIPGAHIARINKPNPGDYVTISKMVYGYSVELTPVQIAMIYAAIANGGRLIHPSLVRELRIDEQVTHRTEPQIIREQFCSPEAIADIRKALHDVVWNNEMGTAALSNGWQQAQSELVHIAGKTGTAQLHTSGGGYDSDHHRISFVGYFPEENPQYSCICVIEAPQRREDLNPKTINAGRGCGAIVRKIAEKVMAYTGCYVMENNQLTLQQRIK